MPAPMTTSSASGPTGCCFGVAMTGGALKDLPAMPSMHVIGSSRSAAAAATIISSSRKSVSILILLKRSMLASLSPCLATLIMKPNGTVMF